MCAQGRLKLACACAQTDQSLRCSHEETLHRVAKTHPVKILIRLRECASWSESSLGAHVRRYVFRRFRSSVSDIPLRKHAYSNILKILPPKNENFHIKNLIFFYISALNTDCGYSLEPPRHVLEQK